MVQEEKCSRSGQDRSVDRPARPVNAREESGGAADQERSSGDQQRRRTRAKWNGSEDKDDQRGEKRGGNRYASPEISDDLPSIHNMFMHNVPRIRPLPRLPSMQRGVGCRSPTGAAPPWMP